MPFFFFFLAYRFEFGYDFIMFLHVLFGEAMLIIAPFSKFFHMIFFFFNRFFVAGEHTIGKPTRIWNMEAQK